MSRQISSDILDADVVIVGGGIVGCSVALGLVQRGARVVILDEGDRAFRASRGNFGMVWVQGKGLDFPAYALLTQMAADAWQGFTEYLHAETGIDTGFIRPGGLSFCLTEQDFEAKKQAMTRLAQQTKGAFRFEMLDAGEVAQRLPQVGDIAGAVYSPHDGAANPLNLLHALHMLLGKRGVIFRTGGQVAAIERDGQTYVVHHQNTKVRAETVLLAAGLGNTALAPQFGFNAAIRPVRGQILVSERLPPLMPYVSGVLRQMPEGTCLIGDTMEEAGYDDGVLTGSIATLAARAVRVFPQLARANLVRSWGALRIMTPDGLPVYEQSETHAGVWMVTVHSGVTLAPVHADLLAQAILENRLPPQMTMFSSQRFAADNPQGHSSSH